MQFGEKGGRLKRKRRQRVLKVGRRKGSSVSLTSKIHRCRERRGGKTGRKNLKTKNKEREVGPVWGKEKALIPQIDESKKEN